MTRREHRGSDPSAHLDARAKGGASRAVLNREILGTAPASLLQMLQTNAEEAMAEYVEVPTRRVTPSQTCPGSGRQHKKALWERTALARVLDVCSGETKQRRRSVSGGH